MRNYIYEVYEIDGKGWEAVPEGLWGYDYVRPQDRLFATAKEAHALARATMGAGCWTVEDRDGALRDETPEIGVRKRCVYEWLFEDDDDEAVLDRVVELHRGDIRLADMPVSAARWMVVMFCGAAEMAGRASAALQGASSATHTAALARGLMRMRAQQIREMFAARGIELGV
jgi:hypothetical protein